MINDITSIILKKETKRLMIYVKLRDNQGKMENQDLKFPVLIPGHFERDDKNR